MEIPTQHRETSDMMSMAVPVAVLKSCILLYLLPILTTKAIFSLVFGQLAILVFLDPVGSLVSTLLVGCWLVVGCHTFSKLVNFECVGVLVC